MYNKELYLKDLEFIKEEIYKINERKEMLKSKYIDDNKPCLLNDVVTIKLNSGRIVKGEVLSFGILKDFKVCVTSYKCASDNKVKYITVPHIQVN